MTLKAPCRTFIAEAQRVQASTYGFGLNHFKSDLTVNNNQNPSLNVGFAYATMQWHYLCHFSLSIPSITIIQSIL
jgi:hypothetical protein